MRNILPVIILIFISANGLVAQTTKDTFSHQRFSADTVKQTIDDIATELSLKHPGFYRYTPKDAFTAFIDSVKLTIHDSLTELESYLKLKAVVSKIHCLHTGISLPAGYRDSINELPVLFPFKLFFTNGKAYVARNFSGNPAILPGDEVVSINGRSIDSITRQLFPLMPSDGYNLTMKYEALFYQFPTWYRSIDLNKSFTTIVNQHGIQVSYDIKGARLNDIAEDGFLREPARAKQLEFKVENNVGFLTLHSFAETEIKKTKQDFKKFIDQAFIRLKKDSIKQLVVDLRDNTGGSDPFAAWFSSYFFDKPFRYWDRIEVTPAIAGEIKGLVLLSYKKPVKKGGVWLWQKAKSTHEFDFYEVQQPAKNNYRGKVYILVNGFCMSSCADVAAVLSHNKKAVFIGEETGGGYQGNNSGMIPETTVMPFGFTLSVPLQKYFNYVDTSVNTGRGTMPDYPVTITIDDIIKGKDKTLDFTLDLIKENKGYKITF